MHVWWLTFPISPRSERRRRFKIRSCRVGSYPSTANGSLMTESRGRMEKWCWKETMSLSLKQLEAYACWKWNMKSSGKWEICARVVSRAAGFPTHQRVSSCHDSQGDCKRGLELILEWSSSWQFDRTLYCFLGKQTPYNFCNQFWWTFLLARTDLTNHCGKFRWSTHLNLVGWGAIPSNHPGRFCPGCWLRITCSLEFSWLRLGRKRHFVGFLWRSICTLTLNTKPLKCNQIPLEVFFKGYIHLTKATKILSTFVFTACFMHSPVRFCYRQVLNHWWESEVSCSLALHCLHWFPDVAGGWRWGIAPANQRLPVLLCHGKNDEVVPFAEGQRQANKVQKLRLLTCCKVQDQLIGTTLLPRTATLLRQSLKDSVTFKELRAWKVLTSDVSARISAISRDSSWDEERIN